MPVETGGSTNPLDTISVKHLEPAAGAAGEPGEPFLHLLYVFGNLAGELFQAPKEVIIAFRRLFCSQTVQQRLTPIVDATHPVEVAVSNRRAKIRIESVKRGDKFSLVHDQSGSFGITVCLAAPVGRPGTAYNNQGSELLVSCPVHGIPGIPDLGQRMNGGINPLHFACPEGCQKLLAGKFIEPEQILRNLAALFKIEA